MQLTTRTYLKNYSAASYLLFYRYSKLALLNYNWSSLVLPCRCTVGVYTPGIAIFAINTIKVVTLLPVRPCVCAEKNSPPPPPRVNTHTHSTRVSQHTTPPNSLNLIVSCVKQNVRGYFGQFSFGT
jgi:hypothetical protein